MTNVINIWFFSVRASSGEDSYSLYALRLLRKGKFSLKQFTERAMYINNLLYVNLLHLCNLT